MTVTSGRRFGLSETGDTSAGGIGKAYQAKDTHLDRIAATNTPRGELLVPEDPRPQPAIPTTFWELVRLLWARSDLRPVLVMSMLLRIPELLIRLTANSKATFFDPEEFPWVRRLETDWTLVRGELDQRLERIEEIPNFQDLQEAQRFLTNDDRWKTYVFYGYGYKDERNCAECPQTARLLETIPGMKTAFFSILDAGKALPPHRGPYKGVLRYHLGLRVPSSDDECAIRVGNDLRNWAEGKSLIFDDSHNHEAWNRTDEVRVVLFVDFLRPLPLPLSLFNAWVVSRIGRTRYVSNGIRKLEQWNERVDAGRLTGQRG